MPTRNRIKLYKKGGLYYIYSRGIEKLEVFAEDADYKFFLELARRYAVKIELVAYCLLPTSIHLIVRQEEEKGITSFMRRVNTAYVMYFNNKYRRRGTLFEGSYKAVSVDEEELADFVRFVHAKPLELSTRRFGIVETRNLYSSSKGENLTKVIAEVKERLGEKVRGL